MAGSMTTRRLSIDAELSRLRRFDERLKKFDPAKLSARAGVDLRILQAAIKKDLFDAEEMASFENNPMIYAQAIDVNIYIKRNFSPLEDRARSIIAIENQTPEHHHRGQDQPRTGPAAPVRRAGHPDRARFSGFPEEGTGRGAEGSEGREAARRFSALQPQGLDRAARLRELAGEGEAAKSDRPMGDRRRKISPDVGGNRTGRFAAG